MAPQVVEALLLLVRAREYATDLGQDPWNHAIEWRLFVRCAWSLLTCVGLSFAALSKCSEKFLFTVDLPVSSSSTMAKLVVTKLRSGSTNGVLMSAASFTLPPWVNRAVNWSDIVDVFEKAEVETTAIQGFAILTEEEKRFLAGLAVSDASKLDESKVRASGSANVSRLSSD